MSFRILKIFHQATEEIKHFLSANVIGTPGVSVVYQQLTTREKLDQLPRPHFACLHRDQLLGLCCFCQRDFQIDQEKVTGFYVRYFSFKETFRTPKKKGKSANASNIIKTEVHHMLQGHPLLSKPAPNFFYAYVDPKNERSAILCEEFGFTTLREFNTYTLGHLFPEKRCSFERISSSNRTEVKEYLHEFYQSYNFYTEDNLFYKDQYYLVRNENGDIVAGLQANPEKWKIHDLPGLTGKILLHVLGKLPITNRLIRHNYQFLALDYIFCLSGHEKDLSDLIETLLYEHSMNAAMILTDVGSSLHTILSKIDMGIIGRLKKPIPISAIAKGNDISTSQWNHLKNYPSFQSSFDTT